MAKKQKKQKETPVVKKILSLVVVSLSTASVAGMIISIYLITKAGDHLVWGNMFINLMVACFTMLLTLLFFFALSTTKKILGKIALGLFGTLFFATSIFSVVTSGQLLQDKELYEKEEYSIMIGKPAHIDYNRPKHSDTTYVTSFEIDGVELITDHLGIEAEYFDEQLKDKKLVVEYLPHSHYAVNVYEGLSQ